MLNILVSVKLQNTITFIKNKFEVLVLFEFVLHPISHLLILHQFSNNILPTCYITPLSFMFNHDRVYQCMRS